MVPPPDFRDIDIHSHLHPDWLVPAIRRWFTQHSNWELEYTSRLNEIDVTNEDLLRWQDRIVFGSDFPNLPHPYEDEREALWRRELPVAGYRKIFYDNASRLLDGW
jgi:amidohydrolase family protein